MYNFAELANLWKYANTGGPVKFILKPLQGELEGRKQLMLAVV